MSSLKSISYNIYTSKGYLDKQYKAFQFNYMFMKNTAMDY